LYGHVQDGESYVAASNDAFKPIDYDNVHEPVWSFSANRSQPLNEVRRTSTAEHASVDRWLHCR
jgi:hypothetical protein